MTDADVVLSILDQAEKGSGLVTMVEELFYWMERPLAPGVILDAWEDEAHNQFEMALDEQNINQMAQYLECATELVRYIRLLKNAGVLPTTHVK